MRLSQYPYVTVRIACSRCPRAGAYRLARRYGAEMTMPHLLELLSGDCKQRERGKVAVYERCGAFFPDLDGTRPPDKQVTASTKLQVVR